MKLKCWLIGHNWIWETLPKYWGENQIGEPKEMINYGKHKAICVRCLESKVEEFLTEEQEGYKRKRFYRKLEGKKRVQK